MKSKYSVTWQADGNNNKRTFAWLCDAIDFASLLRNTNATNIFIGKV